MTKFFEVLIFIILIIAAFLMISHFVTTVKFGQYLYLVKPRFSTSTPQVVTPAPVLQPRTSLSYTSPSVRPTQPTQPIQPVRPTVMPPPGFTLGDLSPFYGKVRIGYVTTFSYLGSGNRINLVSDYSLDTNLDITGWRFRNNKGQEVTIPQAVNLFPPHLVSSLGDIILGRSTNVYFFNSSSHGPSLHLNKCTGYLNGIYRYDPVLPKNCPYIDRSSISHLSGQCQNFILSLGSCETPDLNKFYSSVRSDDTACRSYIDNFSYRGCYARYSGDSNFISNEWRIWLDGQLPLDPSHDRVELLDRNGLLVSLYSY